MPITDRPLARRCLGAAIASLALAALIAAPAMGSPGEERQGARLLSSLQAGKATCTSLRATDFELIGEYVMGRMLGSSAAHEQMNRQITASMGARGEVQAHTYMGQRFAGCATGRAPTAFGAMMGMMGAGMMGAGGGAARGGGGMMGGGSVTPAGSNGWSGADTVMVVLMGLLLTLAIVALGVWRPWQRPPRHETPRDPSPGHA